MFFFVPLKQSLSYIIWMRAPFFCASFVCIRIMSFTMAKPKMRKNHIARGKNAHFVYMIFQWINGFLLWLWMCNLKLMHKLCSGYKFINYTLLIMLNVLWIWRKLNGIQWHSNNTEYNGQKANIILLFCTLISQPFSFDNIENERNETFYGKNNEKKRQWKCIASIARTMGSWNRHTETVNFRDIKWLFESLVLLIISHLVKSLWTMILYCLIIICNKLLFFLNILYRISFSLNVK